MKIINKRYYSARTDKRVIKLIVGEDEYTEIENCKKVTIIHTVKKISNKYVTYFNSYPRYSQYPQYTLQKRKQKKYRNHHSSTQIQPIYLFHISVEFNMYQMWQDRMKHAVTVYLCFINHKISKDIARYCLNTHCQFLTERKRKFNKHTHVIIKRHVYVY